MTRKNYSVDLVHHARNGITCDWSSTMSSVYYSSPGLCLADCRRRRGFGWTIRHEVTFQDDLSRNLMKEESLSEIEENFLNNIKVAYTWKDGMNPFLPVAIDYLYPPSSFAPCVLQSLLKFSTSFFHSTSVPSLGFRSPIMHVALLTFGLTALTLGVSGYPLSRISMEGNTAVTSVFNPNHAANP